MLNKKVYSVLILISVLFLMLGTKANASNVNMNLINNTGVSSSASDALQNSNRNNGQVQTTSQTNSTATSTNSQATTTAQPTQDTASTVRTNSTVIQSVNEINEDTSSFRIGDVLNVLLIAVGFVLILFAIAILIRLK